MSFLKARKIWNSGVSGLNVFADFRAEFPRADRIKVACDGNYALCINGKFAATGQYPGYEDYHFFDEIDISALADRDLNELRLVAHHPGCDFSTYRNQPAFVIFEVTREGEVVCASGIDTLSAADPNLTPGEQVGRVSWQLGFTYDFDSTKAEPVWDRSVEVGGEYGFLPRPIEKLRISEPIEAKLIHKGVFYDRQRDGTAAQRMQNAAITSSYICGGHKLPDENGVMLENEKTPTALKKPDGILALVDLGAENTGILSLDVEVPEECDILIGWGEHLTDLRVRTSIGGRNFASRFHAKAGRNRFEYPLLRLGLRYLQLHIYSDSCKLFYAGIRETRYPLPEPAPCPVDDRLHRMIYDTCARTLDLCMHEHYEDCPWREQSLYTMDSRNQMLCGYSVFGETRFAVASLRLIAHSLRDDGLLELCSPARVSITIPYFSTTFIVQLWEYLEFSRDESTVRELLPVAEKIAESFENRLENGLLRCFADGKYWNFYEWQEGLEESRRNKFGDSDELSLDAPLTAFVSMAFDSLSKLETALGKDGKHWKELSGEMNRASEAFWDEEKGCYASYLKDGKLWHHCELTNSLMVCAGAVPAERLGKLLDALKSGKLIEVTLSHSIYRYDALMKDSSNLGFVMDDIAAKWGHMLRHGATTFWETIEGETSFGNAGSLCHGWSAIPAYVYFRYASK